MGTIFMDVYAVDILAVDIAAEMIALVDDEAFLSGSPCPKSPDPTMR